MPFVVVPEGYESHTFERLLPAPTRHTGRATFNDAASFIRYVGEYSGAATARLYYQVTPSPAFVAVLNHRTAGSPSWGDHRAVYNAPLSPEWKTWTASDGKRMKQEEFALFIEQNLPDVIMPTAAEFLELAQNFQATKAVNFASGTRLGNGQNQLVYEETIQARAGERGQLEIPETFTLGIPVFEGDAAYSLIARLRYRIQDGKLVLWYDLDRPHKIIDDAVKQLRVAIEAETGLVGFNGTPA